MNLECPKWMQPPLHGKINGIGFFRFFKRAEILLFAIESDPGLVIILVW